MEKARVENSNNSIDCIPREGRAELFKFLEDQRPNSDVLLVQGARQVGKTHFIREVLRGNPDAREINLEKEKILREQIDATTSFDEFERVLQNQMGFSRQAPSILFIDEAQESEKLGNYVRFMKEEWPATKTILSGSSMTRLFRSDQRFPVGRVRRFILFPLSFREFLHSRTRAGLLETIAEFPRRRAIAPLFHAELLDEFDRYLRVGGLPQVVLAYNRNENYSRVRQEIFLDQEEDFIQKSEVGEKHLFRAGLEGVANHLGAAAKYSQISEKTAEAKRVISQLVAWHLVLEVEQKGTNSTTSFFPKRYVYDLGMIHSLRRAPFAALSVLSTLNQVLRTDLGGLIENAVALALKRWNSGIFDLTGWKKNSNQPVEVDFVWREGPVFPVECKSAAKVTPRTFKNVEQYLAISGLTTGFVASAAAYQEFSRSGKRLINIPAYLCDPDILLALV